MKRLIIILLIAFGFSSFAQDRTVTLNPLRINETYQKYTAVSADTINSNQDTLDFKFTYRGDYLNKIAFAAKLDTVAGRDTITMEVLGYDFAIDATADATIAAATVDVQADDTPSILVTDNAGGTDEVSFRYYTVRFIRTGSTNEGIKLEQLEFKGYK